MGFLQGGCVSPACSRMRETVLDDFGGIGRCSRMRTLGTECLRKLLTCFKKGQICALEERGRLFHRNTTCTLHEGSYKNASNFQTFKIFRIDKPSRLALVLRWISKLQTFQISTKDVTDYTYTVNWCNEDGDFMWLCNVREVTCCRVNL